MAVTSELSTLLRRVDELRSTVDVVRERYGDVPAVRRLLGDIERLDLDAAELDTLTPLPARPPVGPGPIHLIDDTPTDPSLWAGADDEGLGGHHR